MRNSSDIVVYALKVQQMEIAREQYLAKLKAPVPEKNKALRELQQHQREVQTLTNAILLEANQQGAYGSTRLKQTV